MKEGIISFPNARSLLFSTFSNPKFCRKFSIEHSRHAHVDLTKRSIASQPRSHLRRRRRCKLNWYADTWNTILPESHSLRFYKLRRHARTLLITLSTILIERSFFPANWHGVKLGYVSWSVIERSILLNSFEYYLSHRHR